MATASVEAATTLAITASGFGRGEALLVAGVAVWPVAALVALAIQRPPRREAWLPFGWAVVAATFVGVVMALISIAMFMSNGTTRAMTSLLPTTIAGLCLAGAVICGLVALVLRLTGQHGPSEPSDPAG